MKQLKTLNAGVSGNESKNERSNPNGTPTISPSIHTTMTTTTASDSRSIQNFRLVWLDTNIDEVNNHHTINIITELRTVINTVNTFTNIDKCIEFINGIKTEKTFVMTSGSLSQRLVPNIHHLSQVDAIYIFCANRLRHEQWTTEWIKVKGIHTDITSMCQALHQVTKQCNEDSIAVSLVPVSEGASSQNLDQLESSFMYTKIFKEILLDMEHDQQAIEDLGTYCRQLYSRNTRELKIIHEFEQKYRSKPPIWWYTRECFTYQMLNRALRMLECDTIINMGFFIRDLHEQIQELYQKQIGNYHGKPFTVYRGQGLLKADFEKLVKTKGGLISFNNFLSTSTKRQISLGFAKNALRTTDMIGILFTMNINPSVSSAPFASIQEVSYFKAEAEILFSMHTVFRIAEINKIDNNDSLYQVDLLVTADDDQQLRTLTNRIQEDVGGGTGWQRLGSLLLKLSQFDKAEELYNVLFDQASDEGDKALYYHQLGFIKNGQGDYKMTVEYYEKSLEIYQKTLPANHPDLATSYNNIGLVYYNMGEYSKALSYYEKSLEIRQKTLPANHPSLATSYNNIGGVYQNMGEYSKALSYYEKSLEIYQKTLPENHPDLATSYNNIGMVYKNMGEYSKALSYYEKSLEIKQKTLPANHPDLAQSYNNIGLVYYNMGEYSKAISYYEKSLEIHQKTLPANHPSLATSYNNIGGVYDNMGEYSKALSYYEKSLEIYQKTLPANHPDLATSYNNIGAVYYNMGEYSKALPYYEKSLEIYQKTLPANHPDLATSYNNIGAVYYNMGEYSKALPYYEKSLEFREKTLPENHPDLATSYNNIGGVYDNMGEYSKALSYYEKSLEIYQKTLPANHPHLATSYNNIGMVYKNMGEYSKALSYYEKSLEIKQKTLPANHPDLATSYACHGSVYYNMGEYSKALSYYERALDILQRSLPPNHPHIKSVKESIEIVKKKL